MEVINLSSAVRAHAQRTPGKTYLVEEAEGKEYTYQEVNRLLNRVCALFQSLGLKQGDIISAVIKNSVEYVLLYLASLRYGTIFNPYPSTLEFQDLVRYLRNIRPRIVFCQNKHFPDFRTEGFKTFLVDEGFIASLEDSGKEFSDFVPKEDSPACIYYSSGTTDNPKGIVFSHQNMVANVSSIVNGFRFDEKSIHLIVLPLGHTASINYSFLPCTLSGGVLVIAESFWKIRERFWEQIRRYKVNYVEVVPSILVALLNTDYPKKEYEDINTLPFIGCGSAPLAKEMQLKFQENFGIKVANLYGLSETGPTHFDDPLKQGWVPSSLGLPLDVNEVGIQDEQGRFLAPGEIGEIVVRGKNVFISYYHNKELYDRVVKDGWFHTGDLGYMTSDGRLFFFGRKKDLIIKGGANISPEEIDEALFKIKAVKEALTIGVPDSYLGERIVSYLVLKEGEELSSEDVRGFCSQHLSREKIPDEIRFVDSIPKGSSGKLLRRELREKWSLHDEPGDLSKALELAKQVALEVGRLQLGRFRQRLHVVRKAEKEFVSDVDIECQRLAQSILQAHFPYPVLSEEKQPSDIPGHGLFWIIDPLDGTHNFIAGLSQFGVSVALASKEEFLLGVIYLPFFDELYSALRGRGAELNGQKLCVSGNKALEKSLVTYDNQFYLNEKALERYRRLLKRCFTTRILGSAIYDFGLVASGRADARIWNHTKLFDFAAGIVIVKEAGGEVSDFEGNDINLESKEIVASNGLVHQDLLKVLGEEV